MTEEAWIDPEPLHTAVQSNDLAGVLKCIKDGLDVNAFDELGNTPLHYAAKAANLELTAILLKHGADVNAHDESKIGNTPLSDIAGSCSMPMACLLIEAGADPTIRGWMQLSAIDRAAGRKRGDGPLVHTLLMKAAEGSRWKP